MIFFTVHNSIRDGQCDNLARAPKNLAMSLHKLQNFANTSGMWKTDSTPLHKQARATAAQYLEFVVPVHKGSRF